MRWFSNKQSGMSLFEVMLVLLISSIIVMTGIQYMKRQTESTAAQDYGDKLYILGNAAAKYILANYNTTFMNTNRCFPVTGKNVCNEAILELRSRRQVPSSRQFVANGVDWLKEANAGEDAETKEPYLPDNFTFNTGLDPLLLQSLDGQKKGNDTITFTVIFDQTQPDRLPQIEVTAGVLYAQTPGVDPSTQQPLPPAVRADLTNQAVEYANSKYAAYTGATSILYTSSFSSGSGGITATAPVKGLLTATGGNTGFLRVDGTNDMQGPINFAAATAANNSITNLEQLNFDGTAESAITGLSTLNFGGTGTSKIENLHTYSNGVDAAATINNLTTLNFVSGKGVIYGLTNNVANNSVFRGLKVVSSSADGLGDEYTLGVRQEGFVMGTSSWFIDANNAICMITRLNSNSSNANFVYKQPGSCVLSIKPAPANTTPSGKAWYMATGNVLIGNTCGVICYAWDKPWN